MLALSLACAAASACAAPEAAVDPGWILQQLARPAPTRTRFVELRDSRLLKTPLRIEGEYQRPREDTLVREVRAPYVETTTIRDGEVLIARNGKPPRRFALARAPELQGLQASFGALLAGDRALLEQHYKLAGAGSRARWTLTLTPKDAALAAKVRDITLSGREDELRCIETRPARGAPSSQATQRTLLAGAVHDAAGVSDGQALAALCRDGATR